MLTNLMRPETVLSHVTERSILDAPDLNRYRPLAVGGRARHATVSGVAWFGGHHLAVVNLYGEHLRVYRFHPGDAVSGKAPRLDLLHERTQGLCYPEDVAAAPNGRMLAVTHSMGDDFGVTLHAVDPASLAPKAPGKLLRRGPYFHGLSFSPDSRHLAFTEIGSTGYVEVMRVGSFFRRRTCLLENRHSPLKPKSVAFSKDGRFAVIGLSLNAAEKAGDVVSGAMLSIHRFDAARGVIEPEPVAESRDLGIWPAGLEICAFLPPMPGQTYGILTTNQAADVVTAFEFRPGDRCLAFAGVFQDGLAFPHGVDVSADGDFVAVTNYGDDTLRIVRTNRLVAATAQQATG
jgi:DNA-binding beta-propeller fold protein YncE